MTLVRPRNCTRLLPWVAVLAVAGAAAADDVVHFEGLHDEEIVSQVFRLSGPQTLHVECEGAGDGNAEAMYAYGWILDLGSRETVWALSPANARERGRNLRFEGDVRLPAGTYVAYYAAYGGWRSNVRILRFLGKEIGRIELDDGRKRRSSGDRRRWMMRVSADRARDVDTDLPPSRSDPRTIVKITGVGDNAFEQEGFTLPERMKVTVYCVGEIDEDDAERADFGWILDAHSRRKVWELERRNAEHAGGASINQYARESITLPAGDYIVSYVTDGGHSASEWKGPPPYDPDSWGITVWAGSEAEAARVKPYREDIDAESIVAIVRQRNDSFEEQGLRVARPVRVRVYALGEWAGGEFADHGWIQDFRTQRIVWRMTAENTRPAGGARKNRTADEVIDLPAGDYVVAYETDDSHAYRDWNAAPPGDPTHWGITLLPVGGENAGRGVFTTFNPDAERDKGHDDLVRILRVGDDADKTARFQLDKPQRVRIIAVGEGTGRAMYDYGWIERSGDRLPVWEMTMRNTRHAGGAEKNRAFDGTVQLERGSYTVHYVTDGSHSWGGWNAQRPSDPFLWGIVVRADDKK